MNIERLMILWFELFECGHAKPNISLYKFFNRIHNSFDHILFCERIFAAICKHYKQTNTYSTDTDTISRERESSFFQSQILKMKMKQSKCLNMNRAAKITCGTPTQIIWNVHLDFCLFFVIIITIIAGTLFFYSIIIHDDDDDDSYFPTSLLFRLCIIH